MGLHSAARAIVGRSYVASKRYAKWRMQRSASGPRIVVFSTGKTGSTAIARAVADETGEYVFQVFRLRRDGVAGAEHRYRKRLEARKPAESDASSSTFPGALHLWQSAFLLDHPATPTTPWHVITLVREPVAQAVSAFFHAQAREGFVGHGVALDSLRDRLIDEKWFERAAHWFEREFRPSLGIDVFAQPFDPGAATAIIERDSVRVVLLRQEDLDRTQVALTDFLGLASPIRVRRRNDAESRQDGEIYRSFLASVRFPPEVIDATYASAFSRHFYSATELAQLRSRWTGQSPKTRTEQAHRAAARDVPTG